MLAEKTGRALAAGMPAPDGGDDVDGKRPEDGAAPKAPLAVPSETGARAPFPWPWGLVAIGVMALAWVGVYLLWNGVVFLFGL